jgi:hypothetical protein
VIAAADVDRPMERVHQALSRRASIKQLTRDRCAADLFDQLRRQHFFNELRIVSSRDRRQSEFNTMCIKPSNLDISKLPRY